MLNVLGIATETIEVHIYVGVPHLNVNEVWHVVADESGGLAKCVDFAINSNVKIVHILGTDMSTKMREVTAKHAKKTCIHKGKVHIFYLAAQAKVLLCSLLLETPDV